MTKSYSVTCTLSSQCCQYDPRTKIILSSYRKSRVKWAGEFWCHLARPYVLSLYAGVLRHRMMLVHVLLEFRPVGVLFVADLTHAELFFGLHHHVPDAIADTTADTFVDNTANNIADTAADTIANISADTTPDIVAGDISTTATDTTVDTTTDNISDTTADTTTDTAADTTTDNISNTTTDTTAGTAADTTTDTAADTTTLGDTLVPAALLRPGEGAEAGRALVGLLAGVGAHVLLEGGVVDEALGAVLAAVRVLGGAAVPQQVLAQVADLVEPPAADHAAVCTLTCTQQRLTSMMMMSPLLLLMLPRVSEAGGMQGI